MEMENDSNKNQTLYLAKSVEKLYEIDMNCTVERHNHLQNTEYKKSQQVKKRVVENMNQEFEQNISFEITDQLVNTDRIVSHEVNDTQEIMNHKRISEIDINSLVSDTLESNHLSLKQSFSGEKSIIDNEFNVTRNASIKSRDKPRIYLRYDQTFNLRNQKQNIDENVIIVAPKWVEQGLKILSQNIPKGAEFQVIDGRGGQEIKIIDSELTLKDLVSIARNERSNTTGIIKFEYYEPLITDKSIIYALKDLVRQCVIVGMDKTTHFGGYKTKRVEQKEKVIVIDLIGLQFQTDYNTGRLVLIGENLPKGLLDDMIYENIVGEKKKSYLEVKNDKTGRYIHNMNENIYFDSIAYQKFVANDVFVSGLAANHVTKKDINLKFLKYGTGFFAGSYQTILIENITQGIINGLNQLFDTKFTGYIKSFELPYYIANKAISDVCKKYKIECKFSSNDSLKPLHKYIKIFNRTITATTTCADPHVVAGNEMRWKSVDAAIAENLQSKANKFSPIINENMKIGFINMKTGSITPIYNRSSRMSPTNHN